MTARVGMLDDVAAERLGLAAHVLAGQCSPEEAEAALDDHLDRLF